MQQSYETILIYQKRREPCRTLSLSREAEGFPESIGDDEVDECLVFLRGEGGINPILIHIVHPIPLRALVALHNSFGKENLKFFHTILFFGLT